MTHQAPTGFRSATRAEFFAVMGPLNVHPNTDITALRASAIRSNWELPNRKCVGISFRGTNRDTEFFLPE